MTVKITETPDGNKCENAGFEHSWEDVTPNIVYPTFPPQYPLELRSEMKKRGRFVESAIALIPEYVIRLTRLDKAA